MYALRSWTAATVSRMKSKLPAWVSMLEPNGNVYFADDLELTGGMNTGVVTQFKERLADNSLLVGTKAVA